MDEERPYICDDCKDKLHYSDKTLMEQMLEKYSIQELEFKFPSESVEDYNRKEKQKQRKEKIKEIFG